MKYVVSILSLLLSLASVAEAAPHRARSTAIPTYETTGVAVSHRTPPAPITSIVPDPNPQVRTEQHVVRKRRETLRGPGLPYLENYGKPFAYLAGVPVVSSPYMGVRSEFDGSDLIVNLSVINEDLRLLKHHQRFERSIIKNGLELPRHPVIEISGKVEGLAKYTWPYYGVSTGDIDLASAEVHFLSIINPWVTSYVSLSYDDGYPPAGPTGRRLSNARIFVKEGFMTLGRLERSPFYATLGQFFVPFGRYSTFMLSSTLPQKIGRTKARSFLVGFKQPGNFGFFAATYIFKSESGERDRTQGGMNLGYNFQVGKFSGELAAGLISTIADAEGLQSSGGFGGFAASTIAERIQRRVPAFNTYLTLNAGPFSILGEYIHTFRAFDSLDATFNGHGARLRAWNSELGYHFNAFHRPTTLAIGYGQTREALAFGYPERRWTIAVTSAIWRDTLAIIEYRHSENYGMGNTASGRGEDGGLVPVSTKALGRSENQLSFQFGVYF